MVKPFKVEYAKTYRTFRRIILRLDLTTHMESLRETVGMCERIGYCRFIDKYNKYDEYNKPCIHF